MPLPPSPITPRDWSPRQVKAFRQMVGEGFDNADIKERFGLSHREFLYWRQEFQVTAPTSATFRTRRMGAGLMMRMERDDDAIVARIREQIEHETPQTF